MKTSRQKSLLRWGGVRMIKEFWVMFAVGRTFWKGIPW